MIYIISSCLLSLIFLFFLILSRFKIVKLISQKKSEISILKEKCNFISNQFTEQKELNNLLTKDLNDLDNIKDSLNNKLSSVQATLISERKSNSEKLQLLEISKQNLSKEIKSLSNEALTSNNSNFLELAKTVFDEKESSIAESLKPLKSTILELDKKIFEVEKNRSQSFGQLNQQLNNLNTLQSELRNQTTNLVTALRKPHVRGRWGEIQLKRVIELAGMLNYCDFIEQKSIDAENKFIPDVVVKLPNNKQIIIDAKTPLSAFLDAVEETDEDKKALFLNKHAKQLRDHIVSLSKKSYWAQFENSPEFVVLFIPGDSFYSLALEKDPSLLEFGAEQKVILSTPANLIALLKAVSFGWKQNDISENTLKLAKNSKDLYKRLFNFSKHLSDIQVGLEKSSNAYNKAVSSFEARVLPSARNLEKISNFADKDLIKEQKSINIAFKEVNNNKKN